ncbi:MAG: coproporphyrinogen dehydrogenase HemZ [Oscillospiraceae bacterium]|nr:coproporphyrinogen dehydrogenase HemZ [Oscillospiraceae bacterium]
MELFLINYNTHYEIEQLSRMFFRDLTVTKTDAVPSLPAENYVLIVNKGGAFDITVNHKGQLYTHSLTIDPEGAKEEMQLCTAAYLLYEKATGTSLPWGVLTGVRPVRLMRNLYKSNENIQNVINKFKTEYLVSDEKIKLCTDIFDLQKPVIENGRPMDYSLYISIPFCPSRCSYCSFVSTSIKSAGHLMAGYVDNLCEEIRYTAKKAEQLGLNLKTIYMGGGTPTAITAPMLEQVMKTVQECFDLSKVEEYTVEAGRPDCTDLEKLQIIKKYGADRVSINPQTFSDNVLKAIGRNHTHRDFIRCVNDARKAGFKSINMDLIAGLPEDTVEGFENSLRGCIELGAENITVHTLTMKRASNLVIKNEEHHYDDVSKMIEKNSILAEYGYQPYYMYRQKSTVKNLENVGFSQSGHESLYNIYIMEEIQTIISCGAGGVSKVVGPGGEIDRVYNYKYPTEYIKDFSAILKRKDEVFDICRQYGYQKD